MMNKEDVIIGPYDH